MTIDPKTIVKIKEMKNEGFSDRKVAKQLGVALNTVAKYTESKNYSEKTLDAKKETNDVVKSLENGLEAAKLRSELEDELLMMIDCLNDIEEPNSEVKSLLVELEYLQDQLETADDVEVMRWIKRKSKEAGKKWSQIIDKCLKEYEKDVEKVREENERKKREAKEKI